MMALLPLRIVAQLHNSYIPLTLGLGGWDANEENHDVILVISELHHWEHMICDWFELQLVDPESFLVTLKKAASGEDPVNPRKKATLLGSYIHNLEINRPRPLDSCQSSPSRPLSHSMSVMPLALLESFIRKGFPVLDPQSKNSVFAEEEIDVATKLVRLLDESLFSRCHNFKLILDLEAEKIWVSYTLYDISFAPDPEGEMEPDYSFYEEGCDYPLQLTGHERVVIGSLVHPDS